MTAHEETKNIVNRAYNKTTRAAVEVDYSIWHVAVFPINDALHVDTYFQVIIGGYYHHRGDSVLCAALREAIEGDEP